MSILFISHDLSLVSEIADKVLVVYQGKMVEYGATHQIFNTPQKEYTKALIYARPSLDVRLKKLPTIQDYLEDQEIHNEVITKAQREQHHKTLYQKAPGKYYFTIR